MEWNIQNRFTGWHDVDLADAGFQFDSAYTPLLKRAIRTRWVVLDQLDQIQRDKIGQKASHRCTWQQSSGTRQIFRPNHGQRKLLNSISLHEFLWFTCLILISSVYVITILRMRICSRTRWPKLQIRERQNKVLVPTQGVHITSKRSAMVAPLPKRSNKTTG
jgi:hypothetical protein